MAEGGGRQRMRSVLVIAQVAVSLVLLVAAGLFVRSVQRAQSIDLGFDPRHVLNLSMDVSQQAFDEARGRAFYRDVEARVRRAPRRRVGQLRVFGPVRVLQLERERRGGRSAGAEGPAQAEGRAQHRRTGLLPHPESADRPRPRVHARRRRTRAARGDRQRADGAAVLAGPGSDRQALPHCRATPRSGSRSSACRDPASISSSSRIRVPTCSRRSRSSTARCACSTSARRGRPRRSRRRRRRKSAALNPDLPVYDVRSLEQMLQGPNGFFLLKMGALFGGGLGALGLVLALVGIYGVVSYAAVAANAGDRRPHGARRPAGRHPPPRRRPGAHARRRRDRPRPRRGIRHFAAAGQPAVRDLLDRSADLRHRPADPRVHGRCSRRICRRSAPRASTR